MKSLLYVLPFVALTFFSWGVYGPVLHIGQEHMADMKGLSTLRPFICVGFAYFLIAVVFPLVVLLTKGETGKWSASGAGWSFYAGTIGALGALGIILAFKFKGAPVYVMPLVFGGAPVVNTFVTMYMSRTFGEASKLFITSIIIVAVGAAGVMAFKPSVAKKEKPAQVEAEKRIEKITVDGVSKIRIAKLKPKMGEDGQPELDDNEKPIMDWIPSQNEHKLTSDEGKLLLKEYNKVMQPNLLFVGLSILMTAVCWGSYGPVLHRGQMKMSGSKLRPFMCVGLAYFAVAVILPLCLLPYFPEKGAFDYAHISGLSWSTFAGTVGALGALGIIYAFNFGGKPIFVMPLVFGMAPVVNTFTTIVSEGLYGKVSTQFYGALLMVIVGAVCVLIFAPKPKPKKPAAAEQAKTA